MDKEINIISPIDGDMLNERDVRTAVKWAAEKGYRPEFLEMRF